MEIPQKGTCYQNYVYCRNFGGNSCFSSKDLPKHCYLIQIDLCYQISIKNLETLLSIYSRRVYNRKAFKQICSTLIQFKEKGSMKPKVRIAGWW